MNLVSVGRGAPLLSGTGHLFSRAASAGAVPAGSTFSGPAPSAISGLAGWWDGGALGALLDSNGNPLTSWNAPVAALADKSGGGATLLPFHIASDTSPNVTMAVSRVNGFLGAVGSPDPAIAQYGPTLDPDWGLSLANFDLGSGAAWTLYLVWTRPNWRQGTIQANNDPTPLIHAMATGNTIVSAAGPAGGGLVLFPGTSSSASIAASLDRRHSHALILRNTPGTGVDAWLDGTQVLTATANPLPSSAAGQVLLFHDNTVQGSAQCWFHEAACWTHALDATDIATLVACQGRWARGAA